MAAVDRRSGVEVNAQCVPVGTVEPFSAFEDNDIPAKGAARQFAVIGNSPDPSTVGESTGAVRYELGLVETYSSATGLRWDGKVYVAHIRTRASPGVIGTVLIQMMAARSLKVEIFPGKAASQVAGFDSNAVMFER